MQNDLEERERYVYARKNEIEIIKKIMSMFFVGILMASVLIGILTVMPGAVGAKTWLHNPAALASVYVLTAQPRAETWSIETVDSDGDVGAYPSIALDNNGYPHISYQDSTNEDLKYAKWSGTGWSTTTVDSAGDVGRHPSIALDNNGYPHISYYDGTNGDLKYVKWTGSTWSIKTVDSAGNVGLFTSIALDSNDYPHISYFNSTNEDLNYAKWTGSTWSTTIIDSAGDVGRYPSIALDSDGYPHISYRDSTNEDLKCAKWTGSAWSITTVDSAGNVGAFTSIALDSDGYPHISYFNSTNDDLKYAKWTGSTWSTTTIDSVGDVGKYPSIALDSNGYPHISYRDSTNKDLKYAKLMLEAPTPPRNLQATSGDGYLDLSWNPPSNDGGSPITEYMVYRGTSSGDESYLASSSPTSHNDTTVTNGQTYYYYVVAVNVAGESSPSNKVSAKPQCPPGSPQNVKAAAGDDYVNLEWIAPSDDGGFPITNYNIYRSTTSGVGRLLTTVGNVLTYTDYDVSNDQSYYYKVSAVNSVGEGAKSDEASVTLTSGVTMPSAPRNLIATAGDRVVNLNWNVPVDDGGSTITEYQIYRGTSSDGENYLDSVSASTTSYTDRTVTNDLIYYYRVSAENSVGEGEKSNEVDVRPKSSLTQTTAHLVTTPSAPLNFKASAGDGNVNLEWTEPSDDCGSLKTNYNIYRGTTSGEKTLLKTVSNVLSYTDSHVTNDQKYYYQVSAVNSAGVGKRSDEASATLIPGVSVPSAPQHLNADQGDEYVDLSWNPPSNDGGSPITGYRVYRGTAPQGESFLAEVGNVLIYTDNHVTNDQKYYYQVSAVNLPGEGEKSNEVGVEPKGDTLNMGVLITIIVALIGALGVIAAALINYLSSKNKK